MLLPHITLDHATWAGVGFVIGAFTPKVGRGIKAAAVKILTLAAIEIKKAEAKVVADGEAALASSAAAEIKKAI